LDGDMARGRGDEQQRHRFLTFSASALHVTTNGTKQAHLAVGD